MFCNIEELRQHVYATPNKQSSWFPSVRPTPTHKRTSPLIRPVDRFDRALVVGTCRWGGLGLESFENGISSVCPGK